VILGLGKSTSLFARSLLEPGQASPVVCSHPHHTNKTDPDKSRSLFYGANSDGNTEIRKYPMNWLEFVDIIDFGTWHDIDMIMSLGYKPKTDLINLY